MNSAGAQLQGNMKHKIQKYETVTVSNTRWNADRQNARDTQCVTLFPISSKAPNCIWYTCTIKGMRRSFLQKHFIIIYGLVQLRIVPASISEDNMNHEPNTTDIHLFPFLASVSLALHQHTRSLRHTPLCLGQSLTKQDVIIFSTAFKLQERGLGMTTCESCFSASHSLQLCQTFVSDHQMSNEGNVLENQGERANLTWPANNLPRGENKRSIFTF